MRTVRREQHNQICSFAKSSLWLCSVTTGAGALKVEAGGPSGSCLSSPGEKGQGDVWADGGLFKRSGVLIPGPGLSPEASCSLGPRPEPRKPGHGTYEWTLHRTMHLFSEPSVYGYHTRLSESSAGPPAPLHGSLVGPENPWCVLSHGAQDNEHSMGCGLLTVSSSRPMGLGNVVAWPDLLQILALSDSLARRLEKGNPVCLHFPLQNL